ncbi:origin recognition complex subunit 4-like [Amphiura filiformis]|uniref:origin recognition complex subunit 4-like n=1 Tax=Amphiura filiformis TaxID=82378 RepID=UPI003B226CFA
MSRKRKSVKEIDIDESTVQEIQHVLRARICCNEVPENLDHLQDQRRHLMDLIYRCATLGESNSVLLIGPRGSGKSMLLDSVLDELKENKKVSKTLLTVRLNGLLQTDDRLAIQEITRQLHLDNTVGDRVFGSFSENLSFLLEALKRGDKETSPVLFILDEFDLFAHHKNQTLLYNLFDISQSAQTPVTVIGITCRLDVIELLEKRVKSRFSHRQIHIFNKLNFEQYVEKFCDILSLPPSFQPKHIVTHWNKHIQVLSEYDSILTILRKTFDLDKTIRGLHKLMVIPVCGLSSGHPTLEPVDFLEASKIHSTDSKAAMLHGVSILQLCLIIAMKHLTDLYEGDPFNFEMVFNEYQKFVQKKALSIQRFDKAVVLKAFEHLVALELVRVAEGKGTRIQKEYRAMTLLITNSQLTEGLKIYPNCPSELKQWATNTITS